MLKRSRLNYQNKSKSMTSVPRLIVFDRPQLLEGEDSATYDQLVARVCAAVKPTDIIYEMYIADVITLEWDVLRLRRFTLGCTSSQSERAGAGVRAGRIKRHQSRW
jgi:hypothetical protein